MVTLTARHRRSQRLAGLLDGLTAAWKAVQDSKAVQAELAALGAIGSVRRIEATWGPRHGWHPHLHAYLVVENDTDPTALGDAMFRSWRTSLVSSGLSAPIKSRGGLSVKRLELSTDVDAAAAYLTEDGAYTSEMGAAAKSAASELTDGRRKQAREGNQTLWQVLNRAVAGERRAQRLWHEWETSTKGRRAWAISGSLRKLAALHVRPAVEEPKRTPIGAIPDEGWEQLCRLPRGPGQLLAHVEAAYWRVALSRDGPEDLDGRHADAVKEARAAFDDFCEAFEIRKRHIKVTEAR